MRGRPRKSTEAKILAGTHRADRDGPADSPVKTAGVPIKPADLAVLASELWDSIVPGLVEQGIAGERDTAALVSMVEWWERYRVNMNDLVNVKPNSKAARILQIAAGEASRQFQAFASRFGLTPADRARLRAEPAKKAGVATRPRGK